MRKQTKKGVEMGVCKYILGVKLTQQDGHICGLIQMNDNTDVNIGVNIVHACMNGWMDD